MRNWENVKLKMKGFKIKYYKDMNNPFKDQANYHKSEMIKWRNISIIVGGVAIVFLFLQM